MSVCAWRRVTTPNSSRKTSCPLAKHNVGSGSTPQMLRFGNGVSAGLNLPMRTTGTSGGGGGMVEGLRKTWGPAMLHDKLMQFQGTSTSKLLGDLLEG